MIKKLRIYLTTLLILIISALPVFAQLSPRHLLKLNDRAITPATNARQWTDSIKQIPERKPLLVYLHYNKLPDRSGHSSLAANGIRLLEYLPDNTYAAIIAPDADIDALTSSGVYGVTAVKAEYKASSYLWKTLAEQKGIAGILVSFYPTISRADALQMIAASGGEVVAGPKEQYAAYQVHIAASKVKGLAACYGVRAISPLREMEPLDLQTRPAVKGNVAVTPAALGGYGLLGDSVTVGVGDNCSGIYHADLKDRITNFNPAAPISRHGEHVNGIVGGAGNIDPVAQGMAPHVWLADHYFDYIFTATGVMRHDLNMTITNSSFAVILGDCDYAGTYDGYSQLLDTLALQYTDVLHVTAAGNDGLNTCSPFPNGYATVAGGYQPAKNCLVVGNIQDDLIELPEESRGPTKDGRLKPEIVAVGFNVNSTVGYDQYFVTAGTSMSSPQVAGGAALLSQRYKQLNSGANPASDLLKAIILDGTMDLGNPGPDLNYGFGELDLYRSLKIIDNHSYFTNELNNGDSQTVSINVPPHIGQLKVMLYWHDRPGSASAAQELVNDLDLTVATPGGATHYPLVLDTSPAGVNNDATEQPDHLNNAEQAILNYPAAGTYTLKVKGYHIPFPAQHYVLVYDMTPDSLILTYPRGGEACNNTDSLRIFWEAPVDTGSFTVQFSQDNGTTWTTLANNVPGWQRYCGFVPAGINSGKCLARVTRNSTGDVVTSAQFVINDTPAVSLDTAQCPGYISVHWQPIAGATSYEMLSKQGPYMQVVATITDTTYTFRGMSQTEKSYVAVRPIINGMEAYRSVAKIVVANTGNCTNPISHGDLMAVKIIGPQNGRMYTVTQPGSATTMAIQVQNLYDAACDSYLLSYQVNGGAWTSSPISIPLAANSSQIINIPGPDISDTGFYNIVAAITDLQVPDPFPANDTIHYVIRTIPNDTLTLPFADSFEDVPQLSVAARDSFGITPNGHWDFSTNDTAGRIRSFVDDDVTITGSHSMSMDEDQAVAAGGMNYLTGTFNLATYDTASTEVRVDFDYVLHSTPKTAAGNVVKARADDAQSWSSFFTYDLNAYPGSLNHVQSLSLTDMALVSHRNLSTSTQIAFGQNDTSLIEGPNYGNGITLDNFKLYTVANDAALVSVISPLPTNCGLPSPQPLTVQVHNGVNYKLYNVSLFYSLDSGTVYSDVIDSLLPKATVDFTFTQPLAISSSQTHALSIWLAAPGDTYHANDSILNYHFRNSPIYATFPYLENFEDGDGGYYSDGINNSWQYGAPASTKINKAASGAKAWKTNLSGNYHNLELSYLYSPCFDISALIKPMLSFSMAEDIENCGATLCDQAYMEYTFDGTNWAKLGASGQGTNWYDSTFDAWNTIGFTRWHVASIALPQPPAGETIHFRFVLNSDPGANYEGLAIDDIHIYDLAHAIFPDSANVLTTQSTTANNWTDVLEGDELLLSLDPGNQQLGAVATTLYHHDTLYNPGKTQYTTPRSYTLEPATDNNDSITLKVYLLENEVRQVVNDTSCRSCTFTDAYRLGITTYNSTASRVTENGHLTDDDPAGFRYYPFQRVQWVPYDSGYYCQVKVANTGEIWLNDGGPTATISAGTDYIALAALRTANNVLLTWQSLIDTACSQYELQRSLDGINYAPIKDTNAVHSNIASYDYADVNAFTIADTLYYRLQWRLATGRTGYSPAREVSMEDSAASFITFDAEPSGNNSVLTSWISNIDLIIDHYTLQRAINTGAYATLQTAVAARQNGHQYFYTDQPINEPKGTSIHYRLTATTVAGDVIPLPVRTLVWGYSSFVTDVYPNPVTDGRIHIHWHAPVGTTMNISISEIDGRPFYRSSATATQNDNMTLLQTSQQPTGVYLLRLQLGDDIFTTELLYQQ